MWLVKIADACIIFLSIILLCLEQTPSKKIKIPSFANYFWFFFLLLKLVFKFYKQMFQFILPICFIHTWIIKKSPKNIFTDMARHLRTKLRTIMHKITYCHLTIRLKVTQLRIFNWRVLLRSCIILFQMRKISRQRLVFPAKPQRLTETTISKVWIVSRNFWREKPRFSIVKMRRPAILILTTTIKPSRKWKRGKNLF